MLMKIFAQTFTLDPQSPIETISFAHQHGFHGVEIACEYPRGPLDYSHEAILQIANLAQKYGVPLQVHAPYHNVRLADINPRIREASVQSVKDAIDFANRINAKMVTMHLGNIAKIPLDDFSTRIHKALLDSMITLIEYAEAHEVTIAIENVPSMKSAWEEAVGKKAEELIDIIKEIKAKNIGVTFDVGHANTVGDPAEFATKIAPYVVNIHLHDNDGSTDQHLVIGEGKIDFLRILSIFKKSGYSGPLVLEYFDPASLVKAMKDLQRLLKLLAQE
jgi:sugar phosphate isomerase/epimerase